MYFTKKDKWAENQMLEIRIWSMYFIDVYTMKNAFPQEKNADEEPLSRLSPQEKKYL